MKQIEYQIDRVPIFKTRKDRIDYLNRWGLYGWKLVQSKVDQREVRIDHTFMRELVHDVDRDELMKDLQQLVDVWSMSGTANRIDLLKVLDKHKVQS